MMISQVTVIIVLYCVLANGVAFESELSISTHGPDD